MNSLRNQLSGLVYSTNQGQLCPSCQEAINNCQCQQLEATKYLANLDGWVKLELSTKGRKGKGVTLVKDLPLAGEELKALAKELKTKCGTGGSLKDFVIEIQGDKRSTLQKLLAAKGYKIKLIGG